MLEVASVIQVDRDRLGDSSVFFGTRVPFRAIIDCLRGSQPLSEFLGDFPTISRDQAVTVLRMAAHALADDACSA